MQSSDIDLRISQILKKMEKAMPEIRRQVEVYESKIRLGINVTPPSVPPKFKNV